MGRMGGEQLARPGRAALLRSAGLGGCLPSQRLLSASTRPSLAGRFLRQRRPEPLWEGAGGLRGSLAAFWAGLGGVPAGLFPSRLRHRLLGRDSKRKGI